MNPCKDKITGIARLAITLLASFVLVSCGGGGGGGGGGSTAPAVTTATLQTGTVAVGSAEVGTSVQVSNNNTGQRILTVQNAGSKLSNAQAGQVMVFEASTAMPLGYAGIVQSVQTTTVGGVPTTTVNFTPATIGSVFQNLNLNMSNVGTNPQLMAGVALQNGVRAYTKTEPKAANRVLETIQNGLIQLNVIASNTNTAVGVDFSSGIKATFWKVNGKWTGTDPSDPLAAKVDIVFTGTVELQNPNFSQANIVIQNGKLITHNLQLQGTLKRNIKATVVGDFTANANDLAVLFSSSTSVYNENNGYNEYNFDYKGSSIKVHGVEKDPSKIILGAAIISVAGVVPTSGNTQTGAVLKTIPVGMVVTFFMTADMQVQATASLGYEWRDSDINAGMGISYDDSLGLPISLLTGNVMPPVPFWNSTPYSNQPEGASYDVSGSANATLTAGIDGGIVLAGLVIAQATVEGGIRGNLSGQLSQPVGGTLSGCYSNATVTAGVRSLLDVAAGVELQTNFQSKWLKWLNTSVATGYVYEFPMYPAMGVDWLAETTVWSAGSDTCHIPLFSATAGSGLYSYSFDASATGYQPMVSSYTWDFGDGATATGVTATHTYASSGNYTAILTVLFSDGTQKTISKTITVAAIPALSPAFTVGFTGLQASFNATTSTPSANITGYSWSFGDSATGTGVTASHTYATYSDTPWSVTLTVTDSYGRTASTSQNVSATCPSGQVLQNGQCVSAAVATTVSGLSASQSSADQPINGSFSVSGSSVSMVRVHAGSSSGGTYACYTDLTASAGSKSFSFNGNWTAENNLSCAALLPGAGSTSTIYFKVEARDSANNLANAGTAPVISANYAAATATGYVSQGGLTWMPVSFTNNWAGANAYCTNASINGQLGWRMPTQAELSALYVSGAMNAQGWTLYMTWASNGNYVYLNQSAWGGGNADLPNYVSCVR